MTIERKRKYNPSPDDIERDETIQSKPKIHKPSSNEKNIPDNLAMYDDSSSDEETESEASSFKAVTSNRLSNKKKINENKSKQRIKDTFECESFICDFSLKSKLMIKSNQDLLWIQQFSKVIQNSSDHMTIETKKLLKAMTYYQFPTMTLPDTIFSKIRESPSKYPESSYLKSLFKEWSTALISLYTKCRDTQLPYFYILTHNNCFLFQSSGCQRNSRIRVLINHSNEAFREKLSSYHIDFEVNQENYSLSITGSKPVHFFFDFILNESLSPRLNWIQKGIPFFISPLPFLNASMKHLSLAGFRQFEQEKKLHLSGYITPHAIYQFCMLFSNLSLDAGFEFDTVMKTSNLNVPSVNIQGDEESTVDEDAFSYLNQESSEYLFNSILSSFDIHLSSRPIQFIYKKSKS